jgi:hypothetical protein
MQIEQRPLTSIRPYDRNPRRNDIAVDAVVVSIREFGFRHQRQRMSQVRVLGPPQLERHFPKAARGVIRVVEFARLFVGIGQMQQLAVFGDER